MELMLMTLIVSSGLSLALGLLLLLADRLLSPSGSCELTINDDKTVTVEAGETLLSALFSRKYFVPSACGGKGTCGYCRVKLPGSAIPVLPTEKTVLSSQDLEQGWRLACQIKVRESMKVWMPEEYFAIREYQASVVSTETVATRTREIVLQLQGADKIKFRAGQYIQVHVPHQGAVVYRSYSIASDPRNHDQVILNVRLEDKGLASTWLHSLKVGDQLALSGPYGDFLLSGSGRKIVMIAGGVGLAPMMSILEELKAGPQGLSNAVLFFKVRTRDEFYYLEKLADLASENSGFAYHLVVSDLPENCDFQDGPIGRITGVLEGFMPDFNEAEFYLCGSPALVNGTGDFLKSRSIPSSRIFFDKFE